MIIPISAKKCPFVIVVFPVFVLHLHYSTEILYKSLIDKMLSN